MAFLGLSDGATLVAFGLLLIGINLPGALGHVPSDGRHLRSMSKLRQQVPIFRDVPEDKLFRWISWGVVAGAVVAISMGVVDLLTTKR